MEQCTLFHLPSRLAPAGLFFIIMEILKELEALIPPLTSEEFKQLERNILEEGIRDPLVTWNGILVDGHNRYRIAQEYDIDFTTVEKEFADMNAVKEWMINNQFGRRNLPAYERGKLALRLKDIYSQKAKETKAEKVSHYRQTGEVLQISVKPDTQRDLAKVANVSHDTINKIEKIEAKASDEVKQKLSIGTMSINEAYKEIKKEEKKVERVELIQKQIEDIEEGLLPDLVGLFDVVSVDPPWPYEGESKNITSFDSVGRRVANPYPEMSIEQIKAIELPLMENAVVLLWTTHKFLPDAFEILKEWNLDYKATLVWNKEKIGMGAWFRMQCEFCLVGVKGKPYWENTTYRDIIIESRREHSRKPDSFFEMIEKITMGNRLEYFSREKREGWKVFGNDINKF
jgi:N6-adenosine-specific RNA methylase IME4/DNA-binding XRE family transcriptional regulator